MSHLSDVGNLMHLYLDEIDPGNGTNQSDFLITATARALNQYSDRNWIPVIVKEIGEDQYQVIGNSFIYAVAEAAGLEKVWCIIADNRPETEKLTQVLSREVTPKINLSQASRDEIQAALQYLVEQQKLSLNQSQLLTAINRIDAAPRQYWTSLDPLVDLKCGITRGQKLNAVAEVFDLTPQPMPEVITDVSLLEGLTVTKLKAMAKQRQLRGYSKKKKNELIELLSA